jgi:hypothetical protein
MARGNWARGAMGRSPESGFRGGASPALADLSRPGLVLDKVWPGRKLAACVTHRHGWHGLQRLWRRARQRGRVGAAALAGAHVFGLLGLGMFANRGCVHARC